MDEKPIRQQINQQQTNFLILIQLIQPKFTQKYWKFIKPSNTIRIISFILYINILNSLLIIYNIMKNIYLIVTFAFLYKIILTAQNAIPYLNIGTCNVTCYSCQSSNRFNNCTSCQPPLILSDSQNGICSPLITEVIYYNQYCTELNIQNQNLPMTLYDVAQTIPISSQNINSCYSSSLGNQFYFDFLGLFKSGYSINVFETYSQYIQQTYIMARILYFISPFQVNIYTDFVNNVYDQRLGNLVFNANLTEISIIDQYNQSVKVLNCSFFNGNTSELYYKKIKSNVYSVRSFTISYSIVANYTSNNDTGYWGMREIVVVTKKCKTCPSVKLVAMGALVGKVVGILALIFSALIIFLVLWEYFYIKSKKAFDSIKNLSFDQKKDTKQAKINDALNKLGNKNLLTKLKIIRSQQFQSKNLRESKMY